MATCDSLLIVNQFNGPYAAKDLNIEKCIYTVKDVASKFDVFTIKKIPKEPNVKADTLANLGSVSAALTLSNILIVHIMRPTTYHHHISETRTEVTPNEVDWIKEYI